MKAQELVSLGYEFWSEGGMAGWHKKNTFIKDSMLGEIARYYSEDYIITTHQGKKSEEWLLKNWQPAEDVMMHRFLLVGSKVTPRRQTKSFWLGVRGWLEILHYENSGTGDKKFVDLEFIANNFFNEQ